MSNPKHERFGLGLGRPRDRRGRTEKPSLPEDFFARLQEERQALKQEAARILIARQRRIREFGTEMFSEPAWEMIVNLYTADDEKMDTRSLLALVDVSERIGNRWLDHLEIAGLIQRIGNETKTVALTEKSRFSLDAYLTEVQAFRAEYGA